MCMCACMCVLHEGSSSVGCARDCVYYPAPRESHGELHGSGTSCCSHRCTHLSARSLCRRWRHLLQQLQPRRHTNSPFLNDPPWSAAVATYVPPCVDGASCELHAAPQWISVRMLASCECVCPLVFITAPPTLCVTQGPPQKRARKTGRVSCPGSCRK